MPKNNGNLALKGLDELLFSTEEQRQEEKREQVQQILIDELHPFTNHPFKVVDDEAMTRTVESIAQFGVLAPLIARPRPDGDGYEIISGPRRQFAAKMAGLETLPVIVRDMDDDAATILMVDSNLQREHISPSERAFAYKMKLDALKNQGARSDLTSRQVVGKLEAADVIGKATDESGRQVQRYVRLTNLIPELLNMVDEKMISFNPAVELSYLSPEQQQEMIKAMDDEALLFAVQTGISSELTAGEQLRAKLVAHEENACDFVSVTEDTGVRFALDGIRVPWKIYCIRSAYYIYKSYGTALYHEMLSVLVDAWGGDSDSFLSGILHGMARFLALYQGEYSRERLVLRLRTVHPKTITRLAQNDTGNAADCHMKQILSIYNGAGRTHNLPCKR